jgi:hypothetical protein
VTPTRQVASRRRAARSGECGTGGHERAGVSLHVTQGRGGTFVRTSRADSAARPYRDGVDQPYEPPPGPQPRPHRPAPHADLTALIDAAGGASQSSRAEIAAATAAVLVEAGRSHESGDGCRFVELADQVGLETLAALWQDADPVSLPGALWALYLLRQWCRTASEEVRLLWRAGEPAAPADAVVAGVAEPGDSGSVQNVADAVLNGLYRGDFAVALERAAALFRVVAAGRRELAGPDERGAAERGLAERNERAAADLAAAATKWRAGTLR